MVYHCLTVSIDAVHACMYVRGIVYDAYRRHNFVNM